MPADPSPQEPESDGRETPPRRSRLRGHGPIGIRRLARALAFQTLYEVDLARHKPREVLERIAAGQSVPREASDFALELIAGVLRHRDELDQYIHEKAPAWPLSQMSAIDRNILRLGLYECLHARATVPAKVAINEAIELAKTYGSESTPRFVNGVLGRVLESLPADRTPEPES